MFIMSKLKTCLLCLNSKHVYYVCTPFYQLLKFIVADVIGADLSRNHNSVGLQTTRHLSFNRTPSRVVTGLTGRDTLRRHFHLMRLINSPLHRRCGAEEETSACTLCEWEALTSHRLVYLGSFP